MFKSIFLFFCLAISVKAEDLLTWSNEAPAESIFDSALLTRDPFIIFRPGTVTSAERKTKFGILIYNVTYKFDEYSRRETTTPQNSNYKNIVLLGCSYTLGTGLNNNETFGYMLSQRRKNQNVYNLGIYGAGANDVLDDLRSFKRFSDIAPIGGVVVYTAINDHFERTLCTLNCYRPTYRDWVLKKSNYQFELSSGRLINHGSFLDSRPLQGPLFTALAAIPLFAGMNIPRDLTDRQIELFVRLLAELKEISKAKLKADFYFTLYPQNYLHWPKIKAELEKQKILYLDLSNVDFAKSTDNQHVILRDGHPSKLANSLFAELLDQQLPK